MLPASGRIEPGQATAAGMAAVSGGGADYHHGGTGCGFIGKPAISCLGLPGSVGEFLWTDLPGVHGAVDTGCCSGDGPVRVAGTGGGWSYAQIPGKKPARVRADSHGD